MEYFEKEPDWSFQIKLEIGQKVGLTAA